MAVRNRRKCRNCPEAPKTTVNTSGRVAESAVLSITGPSEGERLWRHIVIGTGTCISMLEQYAKVNMPGNPLRELEDFQERIGCLINQYRGQTDEGDDSTERHAQPGEADLPVADLGSDDDAGRFTQDDGDDSPDWSE